MSEGAVVLAFVIGLVLILGGCIWLSDVALYWKKERTIQYRLAQITIGFGILHLLPGFFLVWIKILFN